MNQAPHECVSCRGVLGSHSNYCALSDPVDTSVDPALVELPVGTMLEPPEVSVEVVGEFTASSIVKGATYAVVIAEEMQATPEFVNAIKNMFDRAEAKGYILDGCLFADLTDEENSKVAAYERGYRDGQSRSLQENFDDGQQAAPDGTDSDRT